jgi:hypothetical protein
MNHIVAVHQVAEAFLVEAASPAAAEEEAVDQAGNKIIIPSYY